MGLSDIAKNAEDNEVQRRVGKTVRRVVRDVKIDNSAIKDKIDEARRSADETVDEAERVKGMMDVLSTAVDLLRDNDHIGSDLASTLRDTIKTSKSGMEAIERKQAISKQSGLEAEKILNDENAMLDLEIDQLEQEIGVLEAEIDELEAQAAERERRDEEKRENLRKKIADLRKMSDNFGEVIAEHEKRLRNPKLEKVAREILEHVKNDFIRSRALIRDQIEELEKDLAAVGT